MTRNGSEGAGSQAVRAQFRLRELILSGGLPPGERVAELALVELLGVSRTPVRAALVRLEEEGLLEQIPTGGFSVRAITVQDIHDAIEIRGAMEGVAARMAAEKGGAPALLDEMARCLDAIDAVLELPEEPNANFGDYVKLNEEFHALLIQLSQSATIVRQIDRVYALPFASPSGFASVQTKFILTIAQDHHRSIYEAIRNREGARAESLAREHARLARRHMVEGRLKNVGDLVIGPGESVDGGNKK